MYFQVKNILKINYYYNTIQTQKKINVKKTMILYLYYNLFRKLYRWYGQEKTQALLINGKLFFFLFIERGTMNFELHGKLITS